MRNFIFGTDWWTDCDDCAALRIISRAHKRREINLLGIGIDAAMEYSLASVDGFLQKEGLFDIPIAIDINACDVLERTRYQKRLAGHAKRYHKNEDSCNPVRLYRYLTANAEGKVDIIEVGFPQNIQAFMESGPDDISPLSGMELMREKVAHIWMMAGKWDEDGGSEYNFNCYERSRIAGHVICNKCPVPITFLGWEVGINVISGSKLKEGDHLYDAFCDHGSKNGRHSWDPMLTLLALIGDPERAGYDCVYGKAFVEPETGKNHFTLDEKGSHRYVVKKYDNEYYSNMIDELIG
ncbi:MAG: hypothetical protein E7334_07975 [Clostridiales bacterium]|nr:hypothetical protein [Clostridiales bacterium]